MWQNTIMPLYTFPILFYCECDFLGKKITLGTKCVCSILFCALLCDLEKLFQQFKAKYYILQNGDNYVLINTKLKTVIYMKGYYNYKRALQMKNIIFCIICLLSQ